MDEPEQERQQEQRASWLELFFDLVVVVTVAALADRLHEDPSLTSIGLTVVMYLAVWLIWVSIMLYGNATGEGMHQRSVVGAMACIAVMAASIPGVTDPHLNSAKAFSGAYVVGRVVGMGVWRTTGKAMVDWPVAQTSIGLTPWIAAIFVHGNPRFWLWTLGLVLDIGLAIFSGSDERRVIGMLRHDRDERSERLRTKAVQERRAGHTARAADLEAYAEQSEQVTPVAVNLGHFDERLGVFMIIVLGEAVTQVVLAASGRSWGGGAGRAAAAAFLLLVGLWWLTFQYGFAASPESQMAHLPARFGLPLHFLTTTSIVFIATGLGLTVAEPLGRIDTGPRWLAAGGLAGYFFVTAVVALAVGASWRWLLLWALPSVLLPLAIAAFGAALAGWAIAALLLLAVAWQVGYGFVFVPRAGGRTDLGGRAPA